MAERSKSKPEPNRPPDTAQDELVLKLAQQLLLKHRIAFRKLAHRS